MASQAIPERSQVTWGGGETDTFKGLVLGKG